MLYLYSHRASDGASPFLGLRPWPCFLLRWKDRRALSPSQPSPPSETLSSRGSRDTTHSWGLPPPAILFQPRSLGSHLPWALILETQGPVFGCLHLPICITPWCSHLISRLLEQAVCLCPPSVQLVPPLEWPLLPLSAHRLPLYPSLTPGTFPAQGLCTCGLLSGTHSPELHTPSPPLPSNCSGDAPPGWGLPEGPTPPASHPGRPPALIPPYLFFCSDCSGYVRSLTWHPLKRKLGGSAVFASSLVCPRGPYSVSFKRGLEFPNLLFFRNDQLLSKLALCLLCIVGLRVWKAARPF